MGLTIDDIVKVNVDVSPISQVGRSFNIGLIIGNSSVTQDSRVVTYSGVDEMLASGFTSAMPEYKAAVLYFAQSPTPAKVAIGLVGDNETALEALQACRNSDVDWYTFAFIPTVESTLTAVTAKAIADYVEGCKTYTVWFSLSGTEVSAALTAGNYQRTMVIQTSSSDAVHCGVMGYAMGANYEGATAYTLAYKPIVGATPESGYTSSDIEALKTNHINAYVKQGSYYDLFRNGVMCNGFHFDDVLFVDMISNAIQTGIMNELSAQKKIPQTDTGVNILLSAIAEPCEDMLDRGYLAPGKWNRNDVKSLKRGDMLTKGYKIMVDSVNAQSQADRDARKAPPIYVCLKTAGAVEYVTVSVTVNR